MPYSPVTTANEWCWRVSKKPLSLLWVDADERKGRDTRANTETSVQQDSLPAYVSVPVNSDNLAQAVQSSPR